jgi:hypothetical protein
MIGPRYRSFRIASAVLRVWVAMRDASVARGVWLSPGWRLAPGAVRCGCRCPARWPLGCWRRLWRLCGCEKGVRRLCLEARQAASLRVLEPCGTPRARCRACRCRSPPAAGRASTGPARTGPGPTALQLLERLVERLVLVRGTRPPSGTGPARTPRRTARRLLCLLTRSVKLGVEGLVGGLSGRLGLFLLAEEAVEGLGQLVDLLLERLDLRVGAPPLPALGSSK